MTLLSPIAAEITLAHTDALKTLAESVKEPEVRRVFLLLFRCVETWELELLVSHIGRGIEADTLHRIQGALASFRLMKDLLEDLGVARAEIPEQQDRRARRFTEGLLKQPSHPV